MASSSSFRSLTLAILLIVLISTTQLPSSLGAAAGSHYDKLMLDRFHRWMSAHGRSYRSADETLRRFEVYRRNVEFIEASNRDAGVLGYELGENKFTDLTNAEFVSVYANGSHPSLSAEGGAGDMVVTKLVGDGHGPSSEVPPASFDWRTKGVVTPVKDQGRCGSCWAFSAVATVESLVKRKGGTELDLSEQELVDCDKTESGCKGGWPSRALQWIKAHDGLVTEAAYNYAGVGASCKSTKGKRRWGNITAVRAVPPLDELELKYAVWRTPVSVGIYSGGPGLQSYAGGVFKGPCTTATSHAVVFVGWGVDNGGVKYWIVKNSWGAGWGENGYFRMRREVTGRYGRGLCGLAAMGNVYPVM